MTTFDKTSDYLETRATREDRIAAIDNIIDALLLAAVDSATTGHLQEYWLDDGQVKIRCNYSGPESIAKAIEAFRLIQATMRNEGKGRVKKLMDSSNFNGQGRSY